MRRLSFAAASAAVALLGACGTDAVDTPTDSASAVTTPDTHTPTGAADLAEMPENAIVLADFEVRADPASGTLEIIRMTETVEGRQLRTTGQAVWCEGIVDADGEAGTGADDTVELFTVDGSVNSALSTDIPGIDSCRSAAINADNPRYDDLFVIDGVFCADVGIRSFYADTIEDVHITLNYSGSAEHAPYQHPYGTGADPDALRGASWDSPNDSDGALIAYGDIDSGANTVVRWFFKHGNDSPFIFTGQVWFTPVEDCDNDTDDDCDGIIDNACREFADGSDCIEASDCESGVCTTDVCQVPTCDDEVENGDETGVDCGGSCPDSCGHPRDAASAGRFFTAMIRVDGRLIESTGYSPSFPGVNWRQVSAGHAGSVCAVDNLGAAYVRRSGGSPFHVFSPGADPVVECAAFELGSIVRRESGRLEASPGATLQSGSVLPNDPGNPFVDIAASRFGYCAVRADNAVLCQGRETGGGNGTWLPPSGTEIEHIAIGLDTACVLDADGHIICRSARGVTAPPNPPGVDYVDMTVAWTVVCGLLEDGNIRCIGDNAPSGLFSGRTRAFATGASLSPRTCVIRSDSGTLDCAGSGDIGQPVLEP